MPLKFVEYGFYSEEFRKFIFEADLAALDAARTAPALAIRQGMAMREASVPNPTPDVVSHDVEIFTGVTARIFTPKNSTSGSKRPLVVIYHGGGWAAGTPSSEPLIINALVGKLGFVGVGIDYRMVPEHPFPTPLEDCYNGLIWAVDNAERLGADANQVYVAGSSAGANLSAAVSLRARDRDYNKIKGQILIVPVTCHYRHYPDNYELESMRILNDVPILPADSMKNFWEWYYPQEAPNAEVSPLLAATHANLPPAYMQIAGADTLRDEGLAYAEALKQAGVKVKLDIYPGMPHGFSMPHFGFTQAATKAATDLEEKTRWLMEQAQSSGNM